MGQETISRLQSKTFKAALRGFVFNAVAVAAIIFGKTFDLDAIGRYFELGWFLLIAGYNMWEFRNAGKGRVEAEKQIQPLPWKQEIQSLRRNP